MCPAASPTEEGSHFDQFTKLLVRSLRSFLISEKQVIPLESDFRSLGVF